MLRLCHRLGLVGLIALAMLPSFAVRAQSRPTPTHPDVRYVPGGSATKQVLDIYLPDGSEGPFPVVFMIHEMGGSKWGFADQAARLVALGYAAISIEYRDITRTAPLGPVNDAFCALAWLHAHAGEYDLDPARIVVFGYSLGGYPATMLGTVDNTDSFMKDCPHPALKAPWIQGAIVYAGALSGPATRAFSLLNEAGDAGINSFDHLLPLYWMDGSEPPFLLIHGLIDTRIPVEESEELAAALEEAGVDVTLLLLPGAGHGLRLYQDIPTPEVDQAVEDFLARIFESGETE